MDPHEPFMIVERDQRSSILKGVMDKACNPFGTYHTIRMASLLSACQRPMVALDVVRLRFAWFEGEGGIRSQAHHKTYSKKRKMNNYNYNSNK